LCKPACQIVSQKSFLNRRFLLQRHEFVSFNEGRKGVTAPFGSNDRVFIKAIVSAPHAGPFR
jgi:hypothetical protein